MSRSYILSALTLATLAVVTPATYGAGSLILKDNFESYPDTASMNAVWNGNVGSTSTLSTNRPGIDPSTTTQALNNLPTAASQQAQRAINPTAIKPSNTSPILFQFDYFYDGIQGASGKRMTGGIRMGTNYIIEMGFYNTSYNPYGANVAGISIRTANTPGSSSLPEGAPGWRIMPNADNTGNFSLTGLTNTWLTFTALIQGNAITYTVDAGRDGTIDSTYVATDSSLNLTAAAFDTVRLGTGLTSGGGADFDNVLIRSLAPGDANHDGVINADDYALIDRGAAKALTGWSNGDFNNDGVIDQNDYLLIDTSYLQQTPSAAASLLASRDAQFGDAYVSELVAAVPEPLLTAPLALLALTFANRRRRA